MEKMDDTEKTVVETEVELEIIFSQIIDRHTIKLEIVYSEIRRNFLVFPYMIPVYFKTAYLQCIYGCLSFKKIYILSIEAIRDFWAFLCFLSIHHAEVKCLFCTYWS